MKKTIKFKTPSAERWIKGGERETSASAMKRLTIDIDAALHRRLKVGCASRGAKIADVVRDLIAREFPAKP